MTTADVLTERAISLAGSRANEEEAVQELLAFSGERRVAVVRARQHVLERLEEQPGDPTATRAVEFLEKVLSRLPV
jgi:hypothetical protein